VVGGVVVLVLPAKVVERETSAPANREADKAVGHEVVEGPAAAQARRHDVVDGHGSSRGHLDGVIHRGAVWEIGARNQKRSDRIGRADLERRVVVVQLAAHHDVVPPVIVADEAAEACGAGRAFRQRGLA